MPEFDHIVTGESFDTVLGNVRYSITSTINATCPNCGNPDCAEMEEFRERLKAQLWPRGLPARPVLSKEMNPNTPTRS